MSHRSRVLALAAGFATVLAAGTLALAQGNGAAPQPSSTAEARLEWAKRHVELVCRPLESQKMFDKATRCYNDVARLMGASSREAPVATAERAAPAQKPAAENVPPPAASATTPAKPRPTARPAPVRTAAAPKPAPVRVAAAPARTRTPSRLITVAQNEGQSAPVIAPTSNRCSGVACLRYTLLGVGF